MKKFIAIVLIAVVGFSNMNAQQKKGNGMQKGSDYTIEQQATLKMKKMTLGLDLNENQQKEVYSFMLENLKERESTREAHRKMKQEGAELNSDQKYNLELQRLDKQIGHKATMKSILTKEQFEKWETMAQKRQRQEKGKHTSGKPVRNGK